MARILGPTTRRVGLYAAFVVLVCPALLWFGAVDLPDEYLEFNTGGLAFHARELAAGRFPQWNPFVLGGMPVAADPTSLSPWYPLGWLLAVVPLDAFVLSSWLLHLGVSGAGVHRLAERSGATGLGARAAAATWLTGTTCIAAIVDGQLDVLALLAWLPWALVALDHAMDSPRAAVWAGAALGLVGLGTHTRFAAIGFAAAGVYGAAVWLCADRGSRPPAGRWAACMVGALGLGTLLAGPEILPAVLEVQASRSAPPDGPMVGQALSWAGLTGLVYPRAFVIDQRWYHLGAAALLAPLALRNNRRAWAVGASGLVLLLVGMGSEGPLGPLLGPFLWALYPVETGAAAIGTLFLAVSVGLGVEAAAEHPIGARMAGALLVVGLVSVVLGHAADVRLYFPDVHGPAVHAGISTAHAAASVLALGAVLALRRRLNPSTVASLLLVLVLIDGLAYAWRVESAIASPTVAPSTYAAATPALMDVPTTTPPGRVVQLPLRPVRELQGRAVTDFDSHPGHGWGHDPSVDPEATIQREATALLRGPLHRNAGSATGTAQVGGRAKVPPMPWSLIAQGLASTAPGTPPELADGPTLARTLELLGVQWVLAEHTDWDLPAGRRLPATSDAALRVELADPRPPALLSPHARVIDDPAEALEELLRGTGDLRTTVILTAPLASELPGEGPAKIGDVLHWEPGAWTVALPEHLGGVLTVQERFHPGWTARSDTGPLPVIRGNLVQLAVPVPPGVRTVELRYRAPGGRPGNAMGLLGLVLLGVGLRFRRRGAAGANTA